MSSHQTSPLIVVTRVSCIIGIIGCAVVIHNGISYFMKSRGVVDVIEEYGPHFARYNDKSNEFGNWLLQSSSFNQSHAATVIMVEKYVYTRDIIAGAIQIGMYGYFLLLLHNIGTQDDVSSQLQKLRDWRILKVKLAVWNGLEVLAIVSYVIAVGVDYGFLVWTTHEGAHSDAAHRFRNRGIMSLFPTYMVVLGLLCFVKVVRDGVAESKAEKELKMETTSKTEKIQKLDS